MFLFWRVGFPFPGLFSLWTRREYGLKGGHLERIFWKSFLRENDGRHDGLRGYRRHYRPYAGRVGVRCLWKLSTCLVYPFRPLLLRHGTDTENQKGRFILKHERLGATTSCAALFLTRNGKSSIIQPQKTEAQSSHLIFIQHHNISTLDRLSCVFMK